MFNNVGHWVQEHPWLVGGMGVLAVPVIFVTRFVLAVRNEIAQIDREDADEHLKRFLEK